jgi:predicted ABC-class ATPase
MLRRIDGKGYKAYRDLAGEYRFEDYIFCIDHVQADPFAPPSRVRAIVPVKETQLPKETLSSLSRRIALRDYLIRSFQLSLREAGSSRHDTGRSGLITIDSPGQEIIARTAMVFWNHAVEARFAIGLPAVGRRIAGQTAHEMIFGVIPQVVKRSLFYRNLDPDSLFTHLEVCENTDFLRQSLPEEGLVAFVADGAILPRASGIDDRPMTGRGVVPFKSPPSLRISFSLPNGGEVTGMGIKKGITLVVGGGFHGKSTLLHALERGIYNHIPGDGREYVVSSPGAVKIRAEDGRRVEKVDISPFISNLPFGRDTRAFCTDDASGSTSQAANIMESLEMGADILLIDEDTSATNFMIRDHRMQELVSKEKEPITPFIDRAEQISSELGVSTILVIGGSGDYFDIAGTVICMEEYCPRDCTIKALEIARKYSSERIAEGSRRFGPFRRRIPLAGSINPKRGRREVKIAARGIHSISFGVHTINLSAIEQLVDGSQTAAIGEAIHFGGRYMDGKRTLSEVVSCVFDEIYKGGLDVLGRRGSRDYAAFRPLDLAAAINRLRSLEVTPQNDVETGPQTRI